MHDNFDKGYVQVYTGSGKGKTTAAIGVTMRAAASGMKVFFGQFMKNTFSSEHKIFADYSSLIRHEQFGTGCFVMGKPGEEDRKLAERGFELCKSAVLGGEYDLVVMDELNLVTSLGLISIEAVLELLDAKSSQLEIIITGRNADKRIIERADLVTEMQEVKHYYSIGVVARKGIEE